MAGLTKSGELITQDKKKLADGLRILYLTPERLAKSKLASRTTHSDIRVQLRNRPSNAKLLALGQACQVIEVMNLLEKIYAAERLGLLAIDEALHPVSSSPEVPEVPGCDMSFCVSGIGKVGAAHFVQLPFREASPRRIASHSGATTFGRTKGPGMQDIARRGTLWLLLGVPDRG